MNYLKKTFSVSVGDSEKYRDNWDSIFGKKPEEPEKDADKKDEEAPPEDKKPE